MSQYLPCKVIRFKIDVFMDEFFMTDDSAEFRYFVEVYFDYPNEIKEKTKNFLFCPENKLVNIIVFTEYVKSNKPKNYGSHDKLICDWGAKQIYYRQLNFVLRMGLKIEKKNEVINFKQKVWKPWLAPYFDLKWKNES